MIGGELMDQSQEKPTISYGDLASLSSALKLAIEGHLMSLEEGRFIWKKHMISVGWKKTADSSVSEDLPEVTETVVKKIKGKITTKVV
jgi:hypothetical protein